MFCLKNLTQKRKIRIREIHENECENFSITFSYYGSLPSALLSCNNIDNNDKLSTTNAYIPGFFMEITGFFNVNQ